MLIATQLTDIIWLVAFVSCCSLCGVVLSWRVCLLWGPEFSMLIG
ncbi:unnamed protein product [Brugia pahangi]|uniref:Metal ABC transporter permease n=1 Tax=Brugia pahangi TaxID=6280 RepID=A0A0N4TC67_BRUPA|nr:unnamed protein product [Brugia pahangi]